MLRHACGYKLANDATILDHCKPTWASKHLKHHALHRARTGSVQNLLEGLIARRSIHAAVCVYSAPFWACLAFAAYAVTVDEDECARAPTRATSQDW